MRKITLIIAFFLSHIAAFCQNKHTVSLLFDNFRLLKSPFPDAKQRELFLSFPGISYEYKPFDKIGIYASYNFWSGNLKFNNRPTLTVTGILDEYIGKIHEHSAYKFFNIGVTYLALNKNKHQIRTRVGIAIAIGKDIYIDRIVWSREPGDPLRDLIAVITHEQRGTHFGGTVGINYDYYFYRNFTIGCNLATQLYANKFNSQINYGLNIGYQF